MILRYTLFSPFRGSNTYLIDMEGNVVHMWPYPNGWISAGSEAIEKHACLPEDGTLLRSHINRAAGDNFNAVFRCVRYDEDYPDLKSRELTPKGKITEIHVK